MGAGQRFEVSIVALDKFTKTFRNLNNQASKAARPLVNIHRQVGALAKELHLDKAAKGIGKVSEAAVTLTKTLGLSLGPLESVLGAGGIVGGLLAAGVGAVALGTRFATAGFEVERTSTAFGLSTRDLQRWRGAARLAGVPLDAMDHTLSNLGTTLQSASFGRDPVALQALNKLGISIRTKNGLVDQNAALEDLADAFSKISDPHVRDVLAEALHIDPATLPLLTQAADGVHKLQNEAERLGVVVGPDALKWSTDFTNSLNHMKVAIDGVGNSLGSKLVPYLTKGMDSLTHGIQTGGFWGGLSKLYGMAPDPASKALSWAAGQFASPSTSSDQRTVSGLIGGPLQQGPMSKAALAAAATASAASVAPGQRINDLNASESASLTAFSPAELARQEADEESAANRRELMREIQRTRDPANRALLEGEMNKIDQKMQLELTFKGLPAGTSVQARSKSENAFMPTLITYSTPGSQP